MTVFGNVSEVWRRNHPWAALYSFGIDRELIARPFAKAFFDSDIRLLYRAAEAIGRVPDGASVLDIPCGSGVALRGLRPGQDVRYVAADIAPAMLERTRAEATRRGLDQVSLQEADVSQLPFADGEFDLVVSFTGLHCFPDPRRAIHEIARVLRPGGRVSGSFVLTDAGLRHRPMLTLARASGLMGPSASGPEATSWLAEARFKDIHLTRSGALGYFTAVRR